MRKSSALTHQEPHIHITVPHSDVSCSYVAEGGPPAIIYPRIHETCTHCPNSKGKRAHSDEDIRYSSLCSGDATDTTFYVDGDKHMETAEKEGAGNATVWKNGEGPPTSSEQASTVSVV